jgi:FkbM family methyltransferase
MARKGMSYHESENIYSIIKKYADPKQIKIIWDIGSRAGNDTKEIASRFPLAELCAFEPNPDTFPQVQQNSLNSYGKIKAFNVALSNSDENIIFYQIDRIKTETTWADGNPGASSLFPASGRYPFEKYVQNPIEVASKRAETLILSGECPPPNLIWMDVQGAEQLVLEGFGAMLENVDFIYVELSLDYIYSGQALAHDVVKYLSRYFYWHSTPRTGSWQFDAVFVNKRFATFGLRMRNIFLSRSLNSGIGLGVRYSKLPIRSLLRDSAKQFWKNFLFLVRQSESKFFGRAVSFLSLKAATFFPTRELNLRAREILSLVQPTNPLKKSDSLPIDLVIPCHEKDIEKLELVIDFAHESITNEIRKVRIVAPAIIKSTLQRLYPNCEILCDEEILAQEIANEIIKTVPTDRQGWVRQQSIKFLAVIQSQAAASLVLDADTLLLANKNWIDNENRQVLSIATEFHKPYKSTFTKFFCGTTHPISFVCHHQLMQKAYVKEMFGNDGSLLLDWIKSADFKFDSALSEYDTYGEWVLMNKSKTVIFSKWNNIAVRAEEIAGLTRSEIKRKFRWYGSISLHSYL